MSKKKICVVTGTRAEYGLLYWLMKKIQEDIELDLQLIVTGAHLSPEFGLTYKQIEDDGFLINEKVEMLLSADTPSSIVKSIGLCTIGLADSFERLKPDLIVLLGDRYEMLAVAQTALVFNIPIAHIAGGDITEGAYDDAIRNSLTKMSHLHFVTNEDSRHRVIQMGEDPNKVFNVGSMGIDNVHKLQLLTKEQIESQLSISFRKYNILVTFHPVTLDNESSEAQLNHLLSALKELQGELDLGIIFTKSNADNGGRKLVNNIEQYCLENDHTYLFSSLGQLKYLSVVKFVDVVVGNSSSGLYEVPSLKRPTVNIGNRQKGRLKASSVLDCEPSAASIKETIIDALNLDCSKTVNPYGDGCSTERIFSVLKSMYDYKELITKHFNEVEFHDK